MNVYQRPLFRQAGGPVAQMQPQMAAPEVAVGQAEAEASAGMERVGIDYLAQTMGGIDAATDAKGLIDALRGNSKPIEARYAELAQFVGEQDARQTPESVLALVQPTLMMTEQGAVDSGIGELMQNIVGQVEMETEGGAPTPMAGGVGSLMMAGAPQAEVGQPPVQNFRNGGLVQRFQVGGEAQGRLGQIYSEMLPVYQSVLGPGGSEEAKAQALFAIAQAAGQFAAGRGPQGEDLRGASPAAAFAANLGGLSGSLQQQAAARAQEERALRLAALQGAQQEYSAERAAARQPRAETMVKGVPQSLFERMTPEDQNRLLFGDAASPDVKGVPLAVFNRFTPEQQARIVGAAPPEPPAEPTVKGVPASIFDQMPPEDKRRLILGDDGVPNVKGVPLDIFNRFTPEQQARIVGAAPLEAENVKGVPLDIFNRFTPEQQARIVGASLEPKPQDVKGIPRDLFEKLSAADQSRILLGDSTIPDVKGVPRDIFEKLPPEQQSLLLGTVENISIKGVPQAVFNRLSAADQSRILLGDSEVPNVKGIPRDIFEKLSPDQQNRILGATESLNIKGVPQEIFERLSLNQQNRILFGEIVLGEGSIAYDASGNVIAQNFKSPEPRTFTLSPGQKVFSEDGKILFENPKGDEARLMTVEGAVIDVTDPANTKVVYQAPTQELREVGGQLLLVDTATGTTNVLFSAPVELKPNYMVIRDNRTGSTTTIDAATEEGRAAIAKANADNAAAGTTVIEVGNLPTDQTPTAKAFLVGNRTVNSFDGGRTYAAEDGTIMQMPPNAVPLSDTIAADVQRSAQLRQAAGDQLDQLNARLGMGLRGGDPNNPQPVSAEDQAVVRNAAEAALNGTGPWSALAAGMDAMLGGAIPTLRDSFQDTQENRQFLRAIAVLGRSALVVNPRFPVAEMERVGALFPDPDAVWRNPRTEANKFVELKALAEQQLQANLSNLAEGRILDEATRGAVLANNHELERLLSLLAGVPRKGEGAPTPAVDSLRNFIRGRR